MNEQQWWMRNMVEQEVVCVDETGCERYLTNGKTYVVEQISGETPNVMVYLEQDDQGGTYQCFLAGRFTPLEVYL